MTLPPPLALVQVRMGSTRLPGKALLPLADGRSILAHVYERAVQAFTQRHVVIACPSSAENDPIREWAATHEWASVMAPNVFSWDGPENDVLGRFWHCSHAYRWHPDSVIVRVTADDPFKSPGAMRRVATGERLPVEMGGEAFTLAMLDEAHRRQQPVECKDGHVAVLPREHLTPILFPAEPPPCPPGAWTVDDQASYEAAVERSRTEGSVPTCRCKSSFDPEFVIQCLCDRGAGAFGLAHVEERAKRADERLRDMVAKSESMFHRRSDP